VTSVIKVSNQELFVGFDHRAHQVRIVAQSQSKTTDAVLRLPESS